VDVFPGLSLLTNPRKTSAIIVILSGEHQNENAPHVGFDTPPLQHIQQPLKRGFVNTAVHFQLAPSARPMPARRQILAREGDPC
jgi:hypothetical protein